MMQNEVSAAAEIVVGQGPVVLQLDEQALLVGRNICLLLDLSFDLVDRYGAGCASGQGDETFCGALLLRRAVLERQAHIDDVPHGCRCCLPARNAFLILGQQDLPTNPQMLPPWRSSLPSSEN